MKAKLTASTLASIETQAAPYEVRDTEIKGFLLRVLPSGSQTYFFQYRNSKGRQQNYRIGPVGSLKPKQARDIAEKLSGQVLAGVDIQAAKKSARVEGERQKFQTWQGFIEHQFGPWATEHRRQGAETLRRLEANFGSMLKEKALVDINSWIVEKWRAGRLKDGVSKATLNRDVGDLKAALAKAKEWGLLEASPLATLKPFKLDERSVIRYLAPDEEKRLSEALKARDAQIRAERASANEWRLARGYELYPDLSQVAFVDYLTPMISVAKNTGMRRGELFHLKWTDVNLTGGQLTVRGEKAKSGQTRHIPLNKVAVAVLTAWKEQTGGQGYVFESANGEALTNIKNSWRGLLKKAKLKDFRFHDLRHDFASKLVMAGVPLNTVRDLLGHGDLKTTLRYAHLAPDHKAEAVELLA